jgi:hypothetical protein
MGGLSRWAAAERKCAASRGDRAEGKGRDGIETRAGRNILRPRKRKPRGPEPHGEIRQSRKEMALPAKMFGQQGWRTKYYLFVKAEAIRWIYLLSNCFIN